VHRVGLVALVPDHQHRHRRCRERRLHRGEAAQQAGTQQPGQRRQEGAAAQEGRDAGKADHRDRDAAANAPLIDESVDVEPAAGFVVHRQVLGGKVVVQRLRRRARRGVVVDEVAVVEQSPLHEFAGIFGLDVQDLGAQQTGMSKDAFKAKLLAAGRNCTWQP